MCKKIDACPTIHFWEGQMNVKSSQEDLREHLHQSDIPVGKQEGWWEIFRSSCDQQHLQKD